MAHKMTYLQNRNGVYRVRKRVPQHLKEIIGRGEFLTQSLGTGNLSEANRLALAVLAEFQNIIDLAEKGEWPPLDPNWLGEVYFHWVTARPKLSIEDAVREYLHTSKITLAPNTLMRLIRECETYQRERQIQRDATNRLLARIEEGELDPQSVTMPVPKVERLDLSDLIDKWAKERQVKAKSKDEFASKLGKLAKFIGHSDTTRYTTEQIIAWKDDLLDTGASHPKVQNYLRVAKVLFNFGVENKLLVINPATEVKFRVRDDGRDTRLPFTPGDAKLLLQAARAESDPVIRWGCWLGALTGARLEEIVGADKRDLTEQNGYWVLDIRLDHRPLDASLKNRISKRLVPLHPVLLEEGVREFAQGTGPLFPGLRPGRYGNKSDHASRLLNPWIHALIPDRRKVYHSWRHYFRDVCDLAGVSEKLQDALCGHSDRKVGRRYGSVKRRESPLQLEILAGAIYQLPNPLAC